MHLGIFSCPICETLIQEQLDVKHEKRDPNDVKSVMRIRCLRSSQCEWHGKESDYWTKHHDTCLAEPDVKCINEGCKAIFRKRDALLHSAQCSMRVIPCRRCNRKIMGHHFDRHKKLECPGRLLQCLECSEKVVAHQLLWHRQNSCNARKITCPLGCDQLVSRNDINNHIAETSPLEHLQSMAKVLQELRKENTHLRQEVNQLTKMTTLSHRLSSFQWQFSASRIKTHSVELESKFWKTTHTKSWKTFLCVGSRVVNQLSLFVRGNVSLNMDVQFSFCIVNSIDDSKSIFKDSHDDGFGKHLIEDKDGKTVIEAGFEIFAECRVLFDEPGFVDDESGMITVRCGVFPLQTSSDVEVREVE